MSLCPVCGRGMCDHTASERSQTDKEMMRPLNKEEMAMFQKNSSSPPYQPDSIRLAQRNAHLK